MNASSILPAAVRDCLVAVVRKDEDLRRFTDECSYRIPMRSVGRAISKDALEEAGVLALYQTSAVTGGLPGAVELWGEIVDRAILPRREIVPSERNHPAADELYYRLRVHGVSHLPAPIISHPPRRMMFLRTTRERLFHAANVNDLIVGTPEEERLWMELRGGTEPVERRLYMRVDGVVMEVDFAFIAGERPGAVLCGDGERPVYDAGDVPHAWRVLRFSPAQLSGSLAHCMNQIECMLRELRIPSR